MSFPFSSTLDAIWARDGEARISQLPAAKIATAMQFLFIVLTRFSRPLGKAERFTSESKTERTKCTSAPGQLSTEGHPSLRKFLAQLEL
jgi:hypothetical protein